MKLKLRKNIYIFSYIIVMIIMGILNTEIYIEQIDKIIQVPFFNNIILFTIVDFIIIYIIMKLLKNEEYIIQERVMLYFKTINNLFLLILFLTSSNFIVTIVNLTTNIFFIILLRPLKQDPRLTNGVEAYFNKHKHDLHKFYRNVDEIKKEYDPLKKELDVEIPALEVTVKNENQNKRRKLLYYLLPILIFILVFTTFIYNFVEVFKTFERARYNAYDVYINGELIKIEYEETYEKTIIPLLYKQKEYDIFKTQDQNNSKSELIYNDEYLINLVEYECFNNEKGNNVKTSCNGKSLHEVRVPIELTKNNMIIKKDNKEIYNNKYINDISNYIKETGKYYFEITNKRENIKTKITFSIEIKNPQ